MKLGTFLLIFVILNVSICLMISQAPRQVHNGNMLYVRIIDESGTHDFQHPNIITNIGERYERNILGFDNVTANNATKWISCGNATPAATLTKLTTEATTLGFSRALGTVTAIDVSNDYSYNVTLTFTSSGTVAVQTVGLHWNPTANSDNNMYAVSYITDGTYHQFTTGSQLIIKWIVVKNDN